MDIPWPTDLDPDLHSSFSELPNILSLSHNHGLSLRDATFGVCEQLIGTTIPDDLLLVVDPTGRSVLSGERLSRFLVPYTRRHSNADSRKHHHNLARFNDYVRRISDALDEAIQTGDGEYEICTPEHIFIAVGTMLLALSRCIVAAYKNYETVQILNQTRMIQKIIQCYGRHLPYMYRIECLLGANIPFIAYATTLPPTINNSHDVKINDYKAHHVYPACSCAFRGPSVEEVNHLLSQDLIPVVVVDGDTVGVRDSTHGPYVAISHVWADGLGSTTDEGLPWCQILRLSELARRLTPGGAFWIDGLCVPDDGSSRRRAISLMASTYQRAAKVLVIDEGIRQQCSMSSPKEDCLLRIATSGWMQRVWTLQEGMLARELYFQVSDGIIHRTHFKGAPSHVAQEIIPILRHRPRNDKKNRFYSFHDIITLLRHRTTSKAEDETLAIAGLLGVDASKLASLPTPEERMRTFLTLQHGGLPRSIAVYGWDTDRLGMRGFAWAPASLVHIFWLGERHDPLRATVTPEGLRALYTVISFPPVIIGHLDYLEFVVTSCQEDGQDADGSKWITHHLPANITRAELGSYYGLAARTDPVTPGVKIFPSNVISRKIMETAMVNAVLSIRLGLPPTHASEEPVAAVFIPSLAADGLSGLSEERPARCNFVAVAKIEVGPPLDSTTPSSPTTERSQKKSETYARMHGLLPVLLS